jgi:RNA polymerase sigma factor (sigma-70 family)
MQNLIEPVAVSTDEDIIDKITSGDLSLFEVLIRRYNPVLYKIARSYGFHHHDAEDLMQDTHVAAYTQLKKFERRSTYKTWISRIMINRCLYKLKYGYFKNEAPGLQHIHAEPMYTNADNNQTEKVVANRELAVILEKSLQTIPLMYRTVFVLRVIEGFSVAESAELLNITEVNVKVRLNRAKALLQRQIEQFYTHADLYSFNLIYCDSLVARVFEKIHTLEDKDNAEGGPGSIYK